MSDTDARLEALETKLAFQEDTLQRLNDALVRQQERIDQLQALLEHLTAELRQRPPGDDEDADERPPHY